MSSGEPNAPAPLPPAGLQALASQLEAHCGAGCVAEPLPGNPDRADFGSRRLYRVVQGGKPVCFLVTGSDLRPLFDRANAFARACPSLVCKPLFFFEYTGRDAAGFEFFEGRNLEELWRTNRLSAERLRQIATGVVEALAASSAESTAEARDRELHALFDEVLALPLFNRIDRGFLSDSVFPLVEQGARSLPPRVRWTNGDLIPRNVFLSADGRVRLLDYEFAAPTHFPSDDAWRWKTFSTLPESLKDLPVTEPSAAAPSGDTSWQELHFLLRQLVLAVRINGADAAGPDSRPALDRLLAIVAEEFPDAPSRSAFLHREFENKVRAAEEQARRLDHLERLLAHRDAELTALRQDPGWRLSDGLRSCARRFFGKRLHVAHYFIDAPVAWRCSGAHLLVRGWCLAEAGQPVAGLQATVGGRTYPGRFGLPRPDVASVHSSHPQSGYCGFEVEVELHPGDKKIELAVRDEKGGWQVFLRQRLRDGGAESVKGTYAHWLRQFDSPSPAAFAALRARTEKLPLQPRLSIILPVFNPPEAFLVRAIESVRSQLYENWELCLADDASTAPHVRPLLEHYRRLDSRIKAVFRPVNGHIAAASNSALELATGDYVAMLDHDDEIRPHALASVVAALNRRPDAELLYCDEDKIDEDGHRFDPYFKPDWMPDLLTGHNYMCHFCVCRTDTVRKLGGWRTGFDGAQDWDLELRIVEKVRSEQIVHLPEILYHWRAIAGSTARAPGEKSYVVEAARRALAEHFSRAGERVELIHLPGNHWRIKYAPPSPAPLVTLIIPTRNGRDLLQRCIDSVFAKTTYPNFEVVVVDNASDEPAARAYLAGLARHPRVRVLPFPQPFNYSAINNLAAREAHGDFLALLNNDLEVITPDWLEEMVSQAARPGIGCVGAMLYFPNDTLQHAGVVLGIAGHAGHAFKGFPRGTAGYLNHAHLVKNYSAVTGACLVVRKAVYEQVGGLDETAFGVSLNDVDFCLRVRAAGYRNLWTPFAELYHHESATRGYEDTPEKQARFSEEREHLRERWLPLLENDPAYNPNLTAEAENFAFAYPPRRSPFCAEKIP